MSVEHVCQDCGQLHQQVQTCLTCQTALPNVAWWYQDGYANGYDAGREWGDTVRGEVIQLVHKLLLQIEPTLPDTVDPHEKHKRALQRQQVLELRQMLADLNPGIRNE
jgi:hypothetical protein